jgi:hypothetical protein
VSKACYSAWASAPLTPAVFWAGPPGRASPCE